MGKILNLEKINSIKRSKIENGMKYIDTMNGSEPVISRVVVFGSAITDNCTENSDIDICLFTEYDNTNEKYRVIRGHLMDEMDDVCDILKYSRLNSSFKSQIEKGVVVYEL